MLEEAMWHNGTLHVSDGTTSEFFLNGIKMTFDGNECKIYNTTFGDYYRDITYTVLPQLQEKGWVVGVYDLSLENYQRKLKTVETSIKEALNNGNNTKKLNSLKQSRSRLIKSYAKIVKKKRDYINKL